MSALKLDAIFCPTQEPSKSNLCNEAPLGLVETLLELNQSEAGYTQSSVSPSPFTDISSTLQHCLPLLLPLTHIGIVLDKSLAFLIPSWNMCFEGLGMK